MKKLRTVIILTIIIILFLPINTILGVDNIDKKNYNPDNLTTNSPSIILMDAKTGKILYSKDAFKRRYPASTTKLMTAILTLENCKLTDVATVSHNAIYSIPVGYSHASLKEGEKLTIEQLLNVLLIPSANDAAIVLAEHIAGSEEKFAEMMNNKAKELGCLDTHFVNPNGIHKENHYSTAYDLSLIGRYAMQFDDIMRIAKISQYTLPKTNKYNKTDRIFNATNALIDKNENYYYEYATGLKTGYTDKAGSCIVSTAEKNGIKLIEVILGSESVTDRYKDCIKLFDYGFENYSYKNLVTSNDVIDTIEIKDATKETKSLNVIAKDNIDILLKNTVDTYNLEPKIELKENLVAPISQDEVIGSISYEIDGETYSTDLIAEHTVIASNFETILFRALLIFLILYLLVIILKKLNRPKNKRKKYSSHSKTNYQSRKKTKSHKGGRYKFTQIQDYL